MSRGRALITGASSGIGESFARLFAEEGFDLVLTARRTSKLETLKTELSATVAVDVFPADLSTNQGIAELTTAITTASLDIDVLVNNAGMMIEAEFTELTLPQLHETLTLNVTALTQLTHHFLPAMLAQKSGRILNVASVAAFHPVPGMDIYAATKAYVLSLTESLAENLRNTGVSATALCPGLTNTGMVNEGLSETMPAFAMSTPEEVAREGFDAMMNKEVIRVPGNANKLALTWAQHQPRWLVRGLGGLVSRITPPRPPAGRRTPGTNQGR